MTANEVTDLRCDVLVVGAGPAGLAAALWAARYRRDVVVVDDGRQRNLAAEVTHGYLGLDGVSPRTLLDAARRDVAGYPTVSCVDGVRVATLRPVEGRAQFVATLSSGATVTAHRVVLATGVRDVVPDIAGFDEHYGASVFHCPSCDGYEARDRRIVVIGWAPHVCGFALELLDWAAHVVVVTHGHQPPTEGEWAPLAHSPAVECVEDRADAFVGSRGGLRAVRLASGREVACELAFFSIAHRTTDELAAMVGCANSAEGCVVVDEHQQTSTAGVYAAGDVTPGVQLVQMAAAKGAAAGIAAAESLLQAGVPPTVRPRGA